MTTYVKQVEHNGGMSPVAVGSGISLRHLAPADLALVAKLHQQAFPHVLWTSLTPELVAKYFGWQTANARDCIALGAWVENTLVGYCTGATAHLSLRSFYRQHLPEILRSLRFHSAKPLLVYFVKRGGRSLGKLFRAQAEKIPLTSEESSQSGSVSFYIMFVAVEAAQRGRGIGKCLVSKMVTEATAMRVANCRLRVHAENTSAVRMYKSLGWKIALQNSNQLLMEKISTQTPGKETGDFVGRTVVTTRILRTDQDFLDIFSEWEQCRQTTERPSLDQHPIAIRTQSVFLNSSGVRAVCLWRGHTLGGAAPLTIKERWEFGWRFPELGLRRHLARFQLRLAEFRGPDFMGNLGEAAARQLLNATLDACEDCDVIRFGELNEESWLGRLLVNRQLIRNKRWLWWRKEGEHRWLVRINGCYRNYLKKFSGSSRRYLMRDARQVEERFGGQLRLLQFSRPEEVSDFVRLGRLISAQSWQDDCLAVGHEAKLKRFAEAGLLRCYILLGGEQPLAYQIGRLSNGVYLAEAAAFDLRFANLSPGKILLMRMLEDLHALGNVRWLDLGSGDFAYKQFWAHESYPEASVLLIKRSLRNAVAFWPMMAAQWPVVVGRRLAGILGRSALYNRLLHRVSKMFRRKR